MDISEDVKCKALGSDSNGRVPGQNFIFPECESLHILVLVQTVVSHLAI